MTDIFRKASRRAIAAAMCMTALQAAAQLHEEISVEGKYVPEIIRTDRIYTFPQALRQSIASSPMDYESSGVATAFPPSLMVMPATAWNASRSISTNPGYLDLGIGSWLNTTMSAGYRLFDDSSSLFGVRMQLDGTGLWKPRLSEATANVRQKRLDAAVGIYGSHVVRGHGRIDASIDYHKGAFNYYGFVPYTDIFQEHDDVDAPNQILNDFLLRAEWHSLTSAVTSLRYSAGINAGYFGYKNLPLPYFDEVKGGHESSVKLYGSLDMPWGDHSRIGADASLDVMIPDRHDTYSVFSLTPFYTFSRGQLDIRIGADINLAFKAGIAGNRYPFFHIAPDVRLSVRKGPAGFYLNALGGTHLNTLRSLHELDYYGAPYLNTTRPSYTPVDAAVGFNLGPFAGFSLGAEARYKATSHVPFGGWYMAYISNDMLPPAGISPAIRNGAPVNYVSNPNGLNIHGYSIAGTMAYDYGRLFNASASIEWQPQDGKKGWFNGYDRPELTAGIKLKSSPVKRLDVGAGLDCRMRRKIYLTADYYAVPSLNGPEATLHSLALPDMILANIYGSWAFSDEWSVWVQADNLLNRHDECLPLQPLQGIVIIAGVKLIF